MTAAGSARSAAKPRSRAARLALALAGLVGLSASAPAAQDDMRGARTKGSANAPVTVYEMSDFQCPYCAQFARETFPILEREYIATGKVRFIFVNFPLPNHANATPAAELAMCAARQNRFWQMHDQLFRHQERWSALREPGTFFLGLVDSIGGDRNAIAQCLRTGAVRELVRRDAENSAASGARSTPSFYIEGGILAGAQPVQVFRQVLDSIHTAKTRR